MHPIHLSCSVDTFPLESAIESAIHTADKLWLPQTVYRNQETCGWYHTNSSATVLGRSEVHATFLPKCYFH